MTTFTREDYEMAAKAAGLWDYSEGCIDIPWSPEANDGDSRRLQVKLGLSIEPYPIYDQEKHSVVVKQRRRTDLMREVNQTEVVELYGDDPDRATRHAVLRCAIAIGKAMP